jgi:hypothetical protein
MDPLKVVRLVNTFIQLRGVKGFGVGWSDTLQRIQI